VIAYLLIRDFPANGFGRDVELRRHLFDTEKLNLLSHFSCLFATSGISAASRCRNYAAERINVSGIRGNSREDAGLPGKMREAFVRDISIVV
jgi:hypothetical protein